MDEILVMLVLEYLNSNPIVYNYKKLFNIERCIIKPSKLKEIWE